MESKRKINQLLKYKEQERLVKVALFEKKMLEKDIAREMGVSERTIYNIKKRIFDTEKKSRKELIEESFMEQERLLRIALIEKNMTIREAARELGLCTRTIVKIKSRLAKNGESLKTRRLCKSYLNIQVEDEF